MWLLAGIIALCMAGSVFGQDIYEKYIITESEMPGYQLIRVSETRLSRGLKNSIPALEQTWLKSGEAKLKYIIIDTAVFDSELQAISEMSDHKGSYSVPFYFGTLTSCIIGDKSWFYRDTHEAAIVFVRGNIGVKISQMASSPEEITFLEILSRRVLDKIEKNLSDSTKAYEEQSRIFQIPQARYEELTNSALSLPGMRDFSSRSVWDSKWKIDETRLVMGRRVEWKSPAGAIIGIDIAELNTETDAKQAVAARYFEVDTFHNNLVFNIDNPSSIDSLVSSWQTDLFVSPIICGISSKGKISVHVYHYHPEGNDTSLFSSLTKVVAGNVSSYQTAVNDSESSYAESPDIFLLHQNTPNPFNPSTTISFDLPQSGPVRLTVYSVSGQKVRELVNGRLSAGRRSVIWDGRDDAGMPVSSGVYLYRLEANGRAESRQMLLLK